MIFLTTEQLIDFHTDIIQEFGGAHGVRDMGLLVSALEMPKTTMFGEFLHPTIYDKAAAYLYHIVCNHPFVDGNKRTGLTAALTFLEVNKIALEYDEYELEQLVIEVAKGEAGKTTVAAFFEKSDVGEV